MRFPDKLGALTLSCVFFNSIVLALAEPPIGKSSGAGEKVSLCVYDKALLQSARTSMSEGHYLQVIEQTNTIIHCDGGLVLRTLIDIYRLRGEAFYGLFLEQQSKQVDEQLMTLPENWFASLKQYELIYQLINSSSNDFTLKDYSYLEDSWRPVITKGFELGVFFQEKKDHSLGLGYYEGVVTFLAMVNPNGSELNNMRALAGVSCGNHYLKGGQLNKAMRFLTMAVPVNASFLLMDEVQLKAKIPLSPEKSSRLYYNLAGLYYRERMMLLEQLKRGDKLGLSEESQLQSLTHSAELYFRLSFVLDPNNIAADNAVNSLGQ